MKALISIAAVTLLLVACGDDTDDTPPPPPTDSGRVDSGGGTDSGSGTDSGTVADAGGGGDAGQILGCAQPGAEPCPGAMVCCSGVPYPEEGVCGPDCPLDSDRALKQGFESVDGDEVLNRLAELRVTRWSYRAEPGVVHVGPMAQDFHSAFAVGKDDRHIHPVDAQGVSIAAIQALHRRVEALEERNRELRLSCR